MNEQTITTLVVLVVAVVAFVSDRIPPPVVAAGVARWRCTSWAAVVLLMCTLLALDVAPAAIIAMTAAGAMVALRVLSVSQAQQSVALPTLVVVAGMIPLSTAIQTSGAADLISEALVRAVGGGNPLLLQLGIVAVVLVLDSSSATSPRC